jgi:hypothetical protein
VEDVEKPRSSRRWRSSSDYYEKGKNKKDAQDCRELVHEAKCISKAISAKLESIDITVWGPFAAIGQGLHGRTRRIEQKQHSLLWLALKGARPIKAREHRDRLAVRLRTRAGMHENRGFWPAIG